MRILDLDPMPPPKYTPPCVLGFLFKLVPISTARRSHSGHWEVNSLLSSGLNHDLILFMLSFCKCNPMSKWLTHKEVEANLMLSQGLSVWRFSIAFRGKSAGKGHLNLLFHTCFSPVLSFPGSGVIATRNTSLASLSLLCYGTPWVMGFRPLCPDNLWLALPLLHCPSYSILHLSPPPPSHWPLCHLASCL